jgi:ABC-type bacteriocin/lantibiotic exporter with double-glycine peptidase domain
MDPSVLITLLLSLGIPALIFFGSIVCVILPLVIVFWLLFRLIRQRKADIQQVNQASLEWVQTTGTILESKVTESSSTNTDGSTSTNYQVNVRYRYQVNGQEFSNKTIRAGDRLGVNLFPTESKAQAEASQFPVGAVVPVYYDPQNPAHSALVR